MYFANIGQKRLNRIRLDVSDGTPIGDFGTIARTITPLDQWNDFTLDLEGSAWIATGGANTSQKIDARTGDVRIVAGDMKSMAIAEPTSAKFGRSECDSTVLYVTAAGGFVTPVDGDTIVGGQFVAVSTGFGRGCS